MPTVTSRIFTVKFLGCSILLTGNNTFKLALEFQEEWLPKYHNTGSVSDKVKPVITGMMLVSAGEV